ncbi:exopolyphosphatase/guanosine-5'-triphosphate,3'-diphosphate pyrophosphatase [Actinoplanes octamycinicus]|uniref:Exopolyphosphatase/guanosine-5'-triphosphate, 3'-diphosphate pyrophosphatase n=1 Tax=Actinoplanes octamycinicus TaxID=135948 RepID=A0A7W7GVD3_9ACTN|nr:Ppx/GppA phosphatase family protein [Actinoplanes octamycinicus]MBB4738984.1 exopolyphosphatase/guanosine-5'-triphosphate,3'-diphosphate pyrophosphatase [Actinoplanes octamycinicus]GIE60113.1 hydrolase [Actinoplanes octamycinicus]
MRVAAIDCGTNAIRLLIADVQGDQLTDVVRRMEVVRLGEGVDRTGMLSPAAIERTRVALADYAAEIAAAGAKEIRMCATSASRDASNAQDFRDMVRGVLGVDPEVITGEEEATLSFLGAVKGLDAEGPYLVFDLGGGSTEFVTGTDAVHRAISVDIGCVRMTERHLHDDPPTAAQLAAAERDVTAAVDTALAAVGGRAARTLVGLAGTVTTVAALAHDLPEYDSARIHHSRVGRDAVTRVTADLLRMTVEQRRALPVMHPGRADVIGAGALIMRIIMERSGHSTVIASEHDILDGIAFGLAGN